MKIGGESPTYELVPVDVASASSTPRGVVAGGEAFAKVLRGFGRSVDQGEGLVRAAERGRLGGLDSGQLIALQAGIYRYSEAVDLLAKLVDRASTAVKTVVSPHG